MWTAAGKKYVVSCCSCQATKPSQRKTAGLMVPIQPQRPWEYAGVDYVGPLPRTQRGNAYILVFVDYFSKWIEVRAARWHATAQVAANKFITDIYARHGSPSYLISDRGTPFVSELFEHVLLTLGTEHRLTTAYHPQTNATKRVNRTLKTAIRAYVGNKHTSWDKYLPQICFALRTALHESTGLSPSMMLYGRELDTPLDLVTQPSWDGLSDPEMPYSDNLRASLRDAHEHSRLVLEESHKRQKHFNDLRRRTVFYEVGDLVRVKSHPKSDASSNFSAKLAPLYTGPCRISKRMSDVNYCLTTVDTGEKVGVFHVANLQPFYTWATALSEPQCKKKREFHSVIVLAVLSLFYFYNIYLNEHSPCGTLSCMPVCQYCTAYFPVLVSTSYPTDHVWRLVKSGLYLCCVRLGTAFV
uniref:Integrase catalytic domain-containing protein n=1 Tax=Neolamprologus brichardi TaxID=32507 RepID=A0A3Q4FYQ3_NEOBR